MKVLGRQRVWAVAIALVAWGCFAVFLRFQSGPWSAVPSFVPVAGVAGFLLYLLEIAYLIYLRGGPPPGATTRVGPGLCWGFTILVVSVVGLTAGFAFNDSVRTYYGLLSLQTVMMGAIAAGMVVTMTGGLWSVPSGFGSDGDAPARGAVESAPPAEDRGSFWRWGLRGAAFPVGAMVAVAPVILLMRALHEWVDTPRCRNLCEAAGYTFDGLLDGKRYACRCLGPAGRHTFSNAPDFLGGHSWALLLLEDGGRLVLYLIAFALPFVLFWLPWATKWETRRRAFAAPSGRSDRVSARAVELAKRETAGTWVLVVEAHYLPHGGSDWIVLTLPAEGGGFIERRREPERRRPMRVESVLAPEASQSIRAQLAARGVWQMRDQLEPVRDGLRATLAIAVSGEVWSAKLHCGARSNGLAELLRFVTDIAPLRDT